MVRMHADVNYQIIDFFKIVNVSAIIPAVAYETMLAHVASHGYVILAPEKVQGVIPALNATWIDDVDQWAQDHLHDRLVNAGIAKNEKSHC